MNKDKKNFVITIDPGHGGADNGTVKFKDELEVKEKDLNLILSHFLVGELLYRGYTVDMTRTDDCGTPLSHRVGLATTIKSNLFISIHFDAFEDEKIEGQRYYFWHKSIDGKKLSKYIRKEAIESKIGSLSHEYLQKYHKLMPNKTFYVLKKTKCTAILIEYFFLTDLTDITLATDLRIQKEIARYTAEGIDNFYHMEIEND